jgi:transposase InsO family protein
MKGYHQNIKHVNNILEKHNIKVSDNQNNFFCDAYIIGKQHKQTFKSSTTNTIVVGEIIHADLCEPIKTISIRGSKYFLLFKDDYSHFRIVHFIKHKSEVKDLIETLIRKIKTDTGFKVKGLRTDNGLEFVNKEITSVLQKYGISHQTTVAYTPEQNRKIERENRTIKEAARTMLYTKNVDKSL